MTVNRYVSIIGVGICLFNIAVASHMTQIAGAGTAVVGVIVYYVAVLLKKKMKRKGEI